MKKLKFTIILILTLFCLYQARSQNSPDLVSQLVSAENYFSALVKESGIKQGFLKVSDENTILMRPNPVKASDYFRKKENEDPGILSWKPAFARISKSNDWGFTTGPYVYRESDSSQRAYYGEYLSIWKKNKKGVWKLALDGGVPHGKPKKEYELAFYNPANEKFLHQPSASRLQQRTDIVLSSDKLFGTILKASNKVARNEFLTDDVRLLFPGSEPIIGKKAVAAFWDKQGVKVTSEPLVADRAYSGELAFTYGNATIYKKGAPKKYNYLRIWEVQPGFKWNVILELFTLAQS